MSAKAIVCSCSRTASAWRLRVCYGRAHAFASLIPEAYEVHKSVIAWRSQFSDDRVPDQVIGLDPVRNHADALGHEKLGSGTLLQYVSGRNAAAALSTGFVARTFLRASHFTLVADRAPQSILDYVQAGRAMQRLWLTCTKLGLQFQPEMTPLIFLWYAATRDKFSQRPGADNEALEIRRQFTQLVSPGRGARRLLRQNRTWKTSSGPVPDRLPLATFSSSKTPEPEPDRNRRT